MSSLMVGGRLSLSWVPRRLAIYLSIHDSFVCPPGRSLSQLIARYERITGPQNNMYLRTWWLRCCHDPNLDVNFPVFVPVPVCTMP